MTPYDSSMEETSSSCPSTPFSGIAAVFNQFSSPSTQTTTCKTCGTPRKSGKTNSKKRSQPSSPLEEEWRKAKRIRYGVDKDYPLEVLHGGSQFNTHIDLNYPLWDEELYFGQFNEGPTISITLRGEEWRIRRHNLIVNSEYAAERFKKSILLWQPEQIVLDDDVVGINANTLEFMAMFLNSKRYEEVAELFDICISEVYEYYEWEYLPPVTAEPNVLRDELPDFYHTAYFFQCDSMVEEVLNKFAFRNFTTLVCLKGSASTKAAAQDNHSRIVQICQALDAVFNPATCAWPIDEEADETETMLSSSRHVHYRTFLANCKKTLSNLSWSDGLTVRPTYTLHPAMEPLRETYVRAIYLNRFDLLNNHVFLRYLATRPHLSADLLNYIAQRGGLGVVYKHHNGDKTIHDDASNAQESSVLTSSMPMVDGKRYSRVTDSTKFYAIRFHLFNSKDWLEMIVRYDFLMRSLWNEIASNIEKQLEGGISSGGLDGPDVGLGYVDLGKQHETLKKESKSPCLAPF